MPSAVHFVFAAAFVLLSALQIARADESPVAWSDDPPLAWTDAKPVAPIQPAVLPPIDFDLSALSAPTPAVAVPAQAAFQRTNIERRESHTCPRCGALVLAKAGRGPEPNTHVHVCPYCNVAWFHGNK